MWKTEVLVLMSFSGLMAQRPGDSLEIAPQRHEGYVSLLIPAVLIGYGVVGLESDQLLDINAGIREELTENIDEKISIDDFSQYAPVATVFALDAVGISAKHPLKQRALVGLTSFLMVAGSVEALKAITKEQRPDGSSRNSFPSGHTATAFAGAEMVWQEYKDRSVWIGISAYAVATGTGIFRMYNNRHWLTDVVAGAGLGMLCTKLSYMFFPSVERQAFKSYTLCVMPSYQNNVPACNVIIRF